MSNYGEGQRWRFTFEGVVIGAEDGVYLRLDDTRTVHLGAAQVYYAQAQRLPDPEPDWQVGDVAMSSDGGSPTSRRIYERVKARDGGAAWWCNGAYLYDHEVPRPLVRLVPEGQS